MNWVIMLAVAAAFWCFVEVELHHLFENGGYRPEVTAKLGPGCQCFGGGALLSTKKIKNVSGILNFKFAYW